MISRGENEARRIRRELAATCLVRDPGYRDVSYPTARDVADAALQRVYGRRSALITFGDNDGTEADAHVGTVRRGLPDQ